MWRPLVSGGRKAIQDAASCSENDVLFGVDACGLKKADLRIFCLFLILVHCLDLQGATYPVLTQNPPLGLWSAGTESA